MMFGFIPTQLGLDDDDERKTWPPAGSASIEIRQVEDALFFSAEWKIVAFVNGVALFESERSNHALTQPVVYMWARHCLRRKYSKLRELGVDVEAAYVMHGGRKSEL